MGVAYLLAWAGTTALWAAELRAEGSDTAAAVAAGLFMGSFWPVTLPIALVVKGRSERG